MIEDPYANRNSLTYLSVKAFEQPALGTIGNMGPLNVQGPPTWQLDLALSRTFQVRENQKLEFRSEAFNLANSLRRMNPTVALNSNVFGQFNTSYDARVMQFVLKYVF